MKALFGLWSSFKVSQINRLLRPFNVRLVLKKSKDWGAQVSLTAHHIKAPTLPPAPVVFSDPGANVVATQNQGPDRCPVPDPGAIIAIGDLGVQRAP